MIKDQFGVTTLGESQYRFKTDVNLIFGKQRKDRQFVLRTTLHSLSVWKTRNPGVEMSPFKIKNLQVEKEAAIVDREVWVYGVNGTIPQDLVAAVKSGELLLQRASLRNTLRYLRQEPQC